MSVLAKLYCSGIRTHLASYKGKSVIGGTVELTVNYTNDPKFREFADASPSGKMELSIDNPEAMKQFIPGKYYDILISESKD